MNATVTERILDGQKLEPWHIPVSILSLRRELLVSLDWNSAAPTSIAISAIDLNTYDASYEGEDEAGEHWKCSPSGEGATRLEATLDLIEKLESVDA